jgi:hypothetical protein
MINQLKSKTTSKILDDENVNLIRDCIAVCILMVHFRGKELVQNWSSADKRVVDKCAVGEKRVAGWTNALLGRQTRCWVDKRVAG